MANTFTITKMYTTGNRRYRAAEIYKPVGVVLHSIGVPQPRARVLRDAWQRDASPYVTHYVLDDTEILHCMPDNYKCWHVGSPGNDKWIGIEMCEPSQITYLSGATFRINDIEAAQEYTAACYRRAVYLIAQLCTKYGWNPYTAVLTHNEVTRRKLSNTDHVDPEHLWNGLGMGYDLAKLRHDVAAQMLVAPPAEEPEKPVELPQEVGQMYRIRKSWSDAASQIGAYSIYENALAAWKSGYAIYDKDGKQVYPFKKYAVRVTASALHVRKGPSTSYASVQLLPRGGAYTIVEERGDWGLLKSYAAKRDGWVNLMFTERI